MPQGWKKKTDVILSARHSHRAASWGMRIRSEPAAAQYEPRRLNVTERHLAEITESFVDSPDCEPAPMRIDRAARRGNRESQGFRRRAVRRLQSQLDAKLMTPLPCAVASGRTHWSATDTHDSARRASAASAPRAAGY